MVKIVVDSSMWIEYFKGSPKGEILRQHIEHDELFITSVCVAEVTAIVLREGFSLDTTIVILQSLAKTIAVNFSQAHDAGVLYADLRKKKQKISLSDVITISVAKSIDAKILTCDHDFQGLANVILVE